MAKDKSKKNAGGDEFAKPSEAPAGGNGFTLASEETKGALLLITPLREETIDDKYHPGETKRIIVADVVVLNEKKPAKSEEHEEVYVFQGFLQGALRGYIGERRVLGRLQNTEDTSKKKVKGQYYWELEDADADDVAVARAYLEAVTNPLAKISKDEKPAKKSKPAPEPEPKKKSKKK